MRGYKSKIELDIKVWRACFIAGAPSGLSFFAKPFSNIEKCGILQEVSVIIRSISERGVSRVVLNRAVKESFAASCREGKVTHAYIIEGARGVGKMDFALYAAQLLFCTSASAPCGVCAQCRKILSRAHPDVYFYGGQSSVTVSDARRMIRDSVISPNDGDRKVYIIENADKMNAAAQNAMLKIFEEPPDPVVFFLLAERRDMLLPTVVSRCRTITISGMDEDEILAELTARYPRRSREQLAEAARLCGRSIGEAEELLGKDGIAEMKRASDFMRGYFGAADRYALYVSVMGGRQKRDSNQLFLLLLCDAFTDIMRVKCEYNHCTVLSVQEAAGYSRAVTLRSASAAICIIQDAYAAITDNGNYNAVMSDMIVRLLAERKQYGQNR